MPPVIYTCYCKLCQYRRGGTFDIVADSIDAHLQRAHKIAWRDSEGDTFRDFAKKIKRLIPSLKGEDGVVEVSVEGAVITYDKVEKVWSIITPLFEISSAGHRITEEERKEAEAIAERLKREREELERERERERKRIKYRKKYHRYHKCYEDYFKTKAFHTLQNLRFERAEFMRLWCEYHSLKPFIDSLSSQELERLKEVEKELKKQSVRPPTTRELLKMEMERFSPSP